MKWEKVETILLYLIMALVVAIMCIGFHLRNQQTMTYDECLDAWYYAHPDYREQQCKHLK